MRFGMVKWFDRNKGFGYIAQPSKNDVFVHYSDIMVSEGEYKALKVGEMVLFEVVEWQGKQKAGRVIPLKSAKERCEQLKKDC